MYCRGSQWTIGILHLEELIWMAERALMNRSCAHVLVLTQSACVYSVRMYPDCLLDTKWKPGRRLAASRDSVDPAPGLWG
jgi:hypothetical protein